MVWFKLGEFDLMEFVLYNYYDKKLLVGKKFVEFVYEVVVKLVVLLKNDVLLFLNKEKIKFVVVVGLFVDYNYLGGYSGQFFYLVSFLKGVKELIGKKGKVIYLNGMGIFVDFIV